MSEVQEEELARTVLDVRIELMDRDFRTFEISALQSVQGENSAREAAVAIARALITAGYSKRDTASGLPAAIEARDKALERVKALEAALENYFQAFDHGGTLLQTADKLCELRDVFRWGHP